MIFTTVAVPVGAQTINFETYDDGSATVDGAAITASQYDAFGVTFSGAVIHACGGGCPDPAFGHFVSSSDFNLPFSITFNGSTNAFSFENVSNSAGTAWAYDASNNLLGNVNFSTFPGLYSFSGVAISKVVFSTASQFGVDNFTFQVSGGVPEPASWALMLGGFGLVGGAMRSRRKAAVTFA